MEINNHKLYSRCRVWWCDVTTSNSIQDGGALFINVLVFDLRMPVQHCTYEGETLLFALIEVNTFICKREISGFSSPLRLSAFEKCQRIQIPDTHWNGSKQYVLPLMLSCQWKDQTVCLLITAVKKQSQKIPVLTADDTLNNQNTDYNKNK